MCASHVLGFGAPDAPVGHLPSTIVYGDFNGDGLPDVATLNTDQSVSVILGHGDGSFSAPAVYTLASTSAGSSQLMVAADFNGDGSPDLAIVETGGTVQILAGSASGTLTPEAPINLTATSAVGLVTADFNADGQPDLAIFEEGSGQVAVLTNTGAFTFAESDLSLLSGAPAAVAAADMDGDGRLDLVAALAGTSTLVIALNKVGGFSAAPLVTLPSVATSLAVRDVNGDKESDVVAGFIDGTVHVLFGDGSGGLGAAQELGAAGTVGVAPLVLADVTGDGLLDVVTVSSQQLTLFPSATLGTWKEPLAFGVGGPAGLASVDVNEDGIADVLVGSANDGSVGVLLATPPDYFAGASLIDTSFGAFSNPVLADVNGDGYLDAVAISAANNAVGVFLNKGDGTFAPVVNYDAGGSEAYPTNVAVADFNGDGRLDLAVANTGVYNPMGGHGAVGVLLGTATGFAPVRQFATPIGYEFQNFEVLAGDFNDDGKQDLLVWTQGYPGSTPSASASILLGTGAGTFGDPTTLSVTFPAEVLELFVGELNGDQTLDLVGIGTYNSPHQRGLLHGPLHAVGQRRWNLRGRRRPHRDGHAGSSPDRKHRARRLQR